MATSMFDLSFFFSLTTHGFTAMREKDLKQVHIILVKRFLPSWLRHMKIYEGGQGNA